MISIRLIFRNMLKNRLYLAINITGLSIAFAISSFILLYTIREISFDTVFKNRSRIYRLLTIKEGFNWTEPSISYPLCNKIKSDIPGVEAATVLRRFRSLSAIINNETTVIRSSYASTSDYFRIFTPAVISGDINLFLTQPFSAVITESLSERLFGRYLSPGEKIDLLISGEPVTLEIAGVIADFPETTSLRPELILPAEMLRYEFKAGSFFEDWMDRWEKDIFTGYVMAERSAAGNDITRRINLLADNLPDGFDYSFSLQPLTRVHLYSGSLVNDSRGGDIKLVTLFISVGALILLIAIFNYLLLSIGASVRRGNEIGVRKIFGAATRNIRVQILAESVTVSLFSLPPAYLLLLLFRGRVEDLFNVKMGITGGYNILLTVAVIILVIITGIASGSYLAYRLGGVSPLRILNLRRREKSGGALFRVLVTLQIIIFVTLLSCSWVMLRQIRFSRDMDPGFDSGSLLCVEFPSGMTNNYEILREKLLKRPVFYDITFGNILPPTRSAALTILKPDNGGEDIRVEGVSSDFSFLGTLGLEVIKGRPFNPLISSDSASFMINETLAGMLHYGEPGGQERWGKTEIIGVFRDFRLHSSKENIEPMTLSICEAKYLSSMIVRYNEESYEEAYKFIEETFSEYDPLYLSIRTFREAAEAMYGREARVGAIVIVFGIVALFLALLGVFGLSLFLSNERRYDTALYKVFGATGTEVVTKYTLGWLLFVFAGNLISIPLVIIIMNRWLEQFSVRVEMGPGMFIIALILSSAIFTLTTVINTSRLAGTDPVDNLRDV